MTSGVDPKMRGRERFGAVGVEVAFGEGGWIQMMFPSVKSPAKKKGNYILS